MSPKTAHPTSPDNNEAAAVAVELGVRIVAFAETLGLVTPTRGRAVSMGDVAAAFDAFAERGVGRHLGPWSERVTTADLASRARRLLVAIDGSPMPDLEWPAVIAVLGEDLSGRLVGVSASSVHRYRTGERSVPDPVAERLHVVAQIVSDLSGSYNDFGIRRWFDRPRAQLDGSTPSGLLRGTWGPDDEPVCRVRELAQALVGAGL